MFVYMRQKEDKKKEYQSIRRTRSTQSKVAMASFRGVGQRMNSLICTVIDSVNLTLQGRQSKRGMWSPKFEAQYVPGTLMATIGNSVSE